MEIWVSDLSDRERAFMAVQLDRLAKRPHHELAKMPEYTEIPVPAELQPFTAGVYCETRPNGDLRIVVQGFRYTGRLLFLRFGSVEARGFSMDAAGSIKELESTDLYDFT